MPTSTMSYLGFNGRCSVETTSYGTLSETLPPDDLRYSYGLDDSYFSENATWFDISNFGDSLEITVTPEKGWRVPEAPMIQCSGWTCYTMDSTDENGSVRFQLYRTPDPYQSTMPYDPNVRYDYVAIGMERVFEVTFDAGEHGALSDESLCVQYVCPGCNAAAPDVIPDSGWEFIGWNRSLENVQEDMYVVAQYKDIPAKVYTVMFVHGEYGTLSNADLQVQYVVEHGAAEDPGIIASNGWDFVAWDQPFDDVISNMTITAGYERIYCTCVFDAEPYGCLAKPSLCTQVVEWGSTPENPGVTLKPEYARDWRFKKRWSPALGAVESNTTFKAVYGPPVYCSVDVEGYGTKTVESGTHMEYDAPDREDAEDVRWTYLGYTGTGSFPSSGTSSRVGAYIYTDSTLMWSYLRWCRVLASSNDPSLGTISISNDSTGECLENEIWVSDNQMLTLRLNAQPTENARFVKYIVNGEEFADEYMTVTVDGPKVIEAVFEKNFYTVTFDPDWCGELMDSSLATQQVSPGQDATDPGCRVLSGYGYRFVRWEPDYHNITGDTRCQAVYEALPTYSVRVDGEEKGPVVSGTQVYFSAPYDEDFGDIRRIYTGFIGTGSFPCSGSEREVSATIYEDSTLDWNREFLYRVTGSSNDPSLGCLYDDMGMEFSEKWVSDGTTVTVYGSPIDKSVRCVRIRVNDEVFESDYASFTVYGPTTVVAEFEPITYSVRVNGEEKGPVVGGTQVSFSAPSDKYDGENTKRVCTGFIGTGSFPCSGSERYVSATIYEDSTLDWIRERQYRVTGSSNDPALGCLYDDMGMEFSEKWVPDGTTVYVHGSPIDQSVRCVRIWVNDEVFESDYAAFTVSGPTTVVAEFEPITYSVRVDGEEKGPVEPGSQVSFSAPEDEYDGENTKRVCTGFIGTGSFPCSGSERYVSATIYEDSTLDWNREYLYRVTGSSNDPALGCLYDDMGMEFSEKWVPDGTTVYVYGYPYGTSVRCVRIRVNDDVYDGDMASFTVYGPTTVVAEFELITYTVTFDPGEHGELKDTSLSVQQVMHGQDATDPGCSVLPGHSYRFVRWEPDYRNITADTTCRAVYELTTCQVTFDPGPYGELMQPELNPQVVEAGKDATDPGVRVMSEYDHDWKFVRWEPDYRNITSDTTCRAVYEPRIWHTVTVDGSVWDVVEHGTTVVISSPEEVHEADMRVVCLGFIGSGSFPSSGTDRTVTVVINEDSSINWIMEKQYRIQGSSNDTLLGRLCDEMTKQEFSEQWLADGTNVCFVGIPNDESAKCVRIWVNGEATDGDWVLIQVNGPATVLAEFKLNTYSVTFDPGPYGELKDNGLAEQTVDYGKDATDPGIAMKPDCEHDWKFVRWEPDYHNITADTTCRAVYAERIWRTVIVDGVAGSVEDGSMFVTNAPVPEVSEGTQVICTGWVGTGSFPERGTANSVAVKIDADSTLTWLFATNYLLTVSHDKLGEVTDLATGSALAPITWLPADTNLSLTATAKEGAVCTNFTVNGEAVDGLNATFALNGPTAVVANFAWKTYSVTFDPGDHGALTDERLAEQTIEHGKNASDPGVTVKAEDAHDWKFAGWDQSFTNITSNTTCRAVYAERIWRTVIVDGVAGSVEDGSMFVTNAPVPEVSEGTQVICTGWVGTGSFPECGTANSVAVKIDADSTLTWLFTTNYLLTVGHSKYGDVIDGATGASAASGWMPAGTNLTFKAVPGEDACFTNWTCTGIDPVPTTEEVSLTMDGPVSLYAAFRPYHVTVTFDPAPHGTIPDGVPSSQRIDYGGDAVEPQVVPQDGWKLAGWDKAFTNVLEDVTVKAKYECLYAITVNGKVITPSNLEDETFVAPGTGTANGQQIVCTGWVGTGSFPESGATNFVTVTITNDSSIVWLYATNYLFEAGVEGPGAICDAETGTPMETCYLPAGTNFVVKAVPDEGAYFSLWDADGMVTNDGPYLVCFLEAPIRAQATFGRDCQIEVGIDDSTWDGVTEDDDIALTGLVTGGEATAYRWRAAKMKDDGTYDVAADIAQTSDGTVQLAAGKWRIEFCALDANGTWSRTVVLELEVLPGAQLPDLQLYGDNVAFFNAEGEEVNHAEVGEQVTVSVELKNGPRAAMEGPVDICLYDGWLSEEDLATFTSLNPNVLAHASVEGLEAGATSLVELLWTVSRDQAGNDLGYGNGPRPLTVVAVSRNHEAEVLTNNNLTGRMFAIGTEEDMDLLRIEISGPSTVTKGSWYPLSVRCWYDYKGEVVPAVGCSVNLVVNGIAVTAPCTPAPSGEYTLCYRYAEEGIVEVSATANDGSLTASASLTYEVIKIPVYKPNLTVRRMALSGSGIYRRDTEPVIVHRNGQVDATACIANNGRTATASAFNVTCQVRKDQGAAWMTVGTTRIDAGFAPGMETNLTFALPPAVTGSKDTWHVCIYADPNDVIEEIDESAFDNSRQKTLAVREGPDLKVALFSVNPSTFVAGEGEKSSLLCAIYNSGLEATTKPFNLLMYVDGEPFGYSRIEETVPSNGRLSLELTPDLSKLSPGGHCIRLYVDSDNEIDELVEENNYSDVVRIYIYPAKPDLRVAAQGISWQPDEVPLVGHEYVFQVQIRNERYAIAATNVNVEFFLETEGTSVSLGKTILNELPRDSSVTVEAPNAYVAERGFHIVRVKVCTEAGIDQFSFDNEANTSFNVEVPVAKVACSEFWDVVAGDPLTLDGSQSERCTGYEWRVVDSPEGSAAILANSTKDVATFIPDIVGQYRLQLCVDDDKYNSEPKEVTVHVNKVYVEATASCGTVTPAGRVIYDVNDRPKYEFTPWVYYRFEEARLDNALLTNAVDGVYTFEPLQRSHKLEMAGTCVYPGRIVQNKDGNYVLYISSSLETYEIDELPNDITHVAVNPNIKTVRLPEGVGLKIVKDEKYDISRFIDCTGVTQNGATVWNVADASLKDTEDGEIAKSLEQLGSLFDPTADSPVKLEKTIEGLTYTLHESTTLDGLNSESETRYTKVGDGEEWTPETSKEPSNSRFYTLSVSK